MAKQKTVLGLDIGTYGVKAVEISGSGDNFSVTGVGWERVPSPDMIEETVRAVLVNNNLKRGKVVTAVSGRSVIVRPVTMAAMDDEELKQAIRHEADKYIPYEVDDVILDCQRLGESDEGGGQIRVLLVAAKKQLIEDHVGMLKRVGLTPTAIDVDLFALSNAFELCNHDADLAAEGEVVALVDIGAAKTSICITRGSGECFTREVFTAGNAMTDAVAKRFGEQPTEVERMKEDPGDALASMHDAILSVIDDLGSEIRLSFDYFENQYDQAVEHVYLSGGGVQFPGIVESLGQVFDLEAQKFSPFESIDVSATDDVILHEKASDMVVAMGLAARISGL